VTRELPLAAGQRRASGAHLRLNLAPEEKPMSSHTYKLIELVGSSASGSDDAIRNALSKAGESVKHMDWFQVIETRGHILDGKVSHFQVVLKVGFRIE
jgi:flavin-binding protein dodecin